MRSLTLKDFRCFHKRQTARLAPLTLLVGENSTGKTSFMAMIRALFEYAIGSQIPDFKREPYDLGSFDDIAHHRGGASARANSFEGGFDATSLMLTDRPGDESLYHFEVTFKNKGVTPAPVGRRLAYGDTWYEELFEPRGPHIVRVGTCRGSWERQVPDEISIPFGTDTILLPALFRFMKIFERGDVEEQSAERKGFEPLDGSPNLSPEDEKSLENLTLGLRHLRPRIPFASAPVRSKPRRTYDPSRVTVDPEGEYVPMYFASLYFQDRNEWTYLKEDLEDFGKAAGLFDEISIKPLGKRGSGPFQLLLRKFGRRLKGPPRNLIDVGYGVSQVLPVITELLRPDAPSMFLLQQPEVHLHPSAQAALGSLFCQVASRDRQLVVETHSDHLLDRVRMDVRDGEGALKPDDVSILFFERGDLDVRIHSLRIDEEGNIIGAPDSYRTFFMEETARSLWNRRISARI